MKNICNFFCTVSVLSLFGCLFLPSALGQAPDFTPPPPEYTALQSEIHAIVQQLQHIEQTVEPQSETAQRLQKAITRTQESINLAPQIPPRTVRDFQSATRDAIQELLILEQELRQTVDPKVPLSREMQNLAITRAQLEGIALLVEAASGRTTSPVPGKVREEGIFEEGIFDNDNRVIGSRLIINIPIESTVKVYRVARPSGVPESAYPLGPPPRGFIEVAITAPHQSPSGRIAGLPGYATTYRTALPSATVEVSAGQVVISQLLLGVPPEAVNTSSSETAGQIPGTVPNDAPNPWEGEKEKAYIDFARRFFYEIPSHAIPDTDTKKQEAIEQFKRFYDKITPRHQFDLIVELMQEVPIGSTNLILLGELLESIPTPPVTSNSQ